jgi:hypothetical protein
MVRFIPIAFRTLPRGAHYDYCTDVQAALLAADSEVREALGTLPDAFGQWLDREQALMNWVRKSDLTAPVVEARKQVGRALVSLSTLVRAHRFSPAPATADAAEEVYVMLKNYGRVYRDAYGVQDGKLRVIVDHLLTDYAPEVALLGLTGLVDDLQSALTGFRQLLARRSTQWGRKPEENLKAVRRGIEAVYHQIVRIVNAGATLGRPGFEAFINGLNGKIERVNAEFHRVRHKIGLAEIEAIPPQPHTGAPVTPTPAVHYPTHSGTVLLELGKDYILTYRHNIREGLAQCIVHGKGAYAGRRMMTFSIIKN